MSAWPRPQRVAVAAFAAFACIELGFAVWAAFVAHGFAGPRVGYGPDSALYVAAARAPVWSRNFWAGPGAFGFLLLAKLCARNLRAIVLVQTVLAIGAWSFLATAVSGALRSDAARWVALAGILGVALTPGVLQWNAMIVTESLSLSTLCFLIGCAIRLVQRGGPRDLVLLLAALAAFAYTRDTNALVVGGIGVVALVCTLKPAYRRGGAVIGATCIALAVSAMLLANAARPPRWYWPVAETTAIRLLAEPDTTRYLVDHGFPWSPQMRLLPQHYYYLYAPVREGAEFAAFREWVRHDGRRVYLDYLVSHPGWALRKPFDDRNRVLDIGGVEVYGRLYHNRPGGPFTAVGVIAAPRAQRVLEVWTGAAAVVLLVLVLRRRVGRPLGGVIGLVGLFAVAGYYAAWYGDALEVNRHALTAGVQLRVWCWIVTALAVDAAVASARRSEVQEPEDDELDEHEYQRAPVLGDV